MSESLKRFGQSRGDKGSSGRTADVGRQAGRWAEPPLEPTPLPPSGQMIKNAYWVSKMSFCVIELVNCIAPNKWAE